MKGTPETEQTRHFPDDSVTESNKNEAQAITKHGFLSF